MAEIKSALEIAMERSEGIKGDKALLQKHDLKNEGMKLVSAFLDPASQAELSPSKAVQGRSREDSSALKEGMLIALLSNLTLPRGEESLKTLERVTKGLEIMFRGSPQAKELLSQLAQFFPQYHASKEQMFKQAEAQFAQKLKAKEQELSRQYGREVRLNPASDPEYASSISKLSARLDGQYQAALTEVKEELQDLFKKL